MLTVADARVATKSAFDAFAEDVRERGAVTVAKECGVSTETARRISQGIGRNRVETQKKVLEHAVRIGKGDVGNIKAILDAFWG